MKQKIVKLRHLLINDPVNSHDYIFKFLKQFFTLAEISLLEDVHLKNFIQTVVLHGEDLVVDPKIKMKQFIKSSMLGQATFVSQKDYLMIDQATSPLIKSSNCSLQNLPSKSKSLSPDQTLRLDESIQHSIATKEPLMVNRYANKGGGGGVVGGETLEEDDNIILSNLEQFQVGLSSDPRSPQSPRLPAASQPP